MKVGFIGLGAMGRHMARHLQEAGHDMTVHDIRREAATPFLEAGADWADTPKGVALASEVILTSLPGPVNVEGVVLGPDGIADGVTEGLASRARAGTHQGHRQRQPDQEGHDGLADEPDHRRDVALAERCGREGRRSSSTEVRRCCRRALRPSPRAAEYGNQDW